MRREPRNRLRGAALLTGVVLLSFDGAAESSSALLPSQLGIEDHLREWPEFTAAARDRARRDLTAADMVRVQNLLDEAYSTERLQRAIERAILADASPERRTAVSQVAESPVFARHRARIEYQRGPDGLRAQPIRMGEAMKDGPDRQRLTAIGRLSSATGRTENLLAVAVSIGESVARAHHGLSCGPPAEAEQAAERVREEIASAARQFASYDLHLLNLSYWDASQREIDEMVEAMESENLRWLHGRLRLHLEEGLQRSEVQFAAGVAELREARCVVQ